MSTWSEMIDVRTRVWAVVAIIVGIALAIGLELVDEPDATAADLLLELVETTPAVLTSVGVAVLALVSKRQRDEHLQIVHDLEIARLQGQRWRAESRNLLNGLGKAIEEQFSRWKLTEAERNIALLLLKGLSIKEAAVVRGSTERTVREQARSVYAKAGVTGRAGLSAFFLEDLLVPTPVDVNDKAS